MTTGTASAAAVEPAGPAEPAATGVPVAGAPVQAVGRPTSDVERRPRESLAVLVSFAVAYAVLGYWVVVEQHVVGFETLERWSRAAAVWLDQPAGLAPTGLDLPPLAVLLLAPLGWATAVVPPLALVPVVPSVLAGWTMVVLNTTMRRAQVTAPLRLGVLGALGANPLLVMSVTTGERDLLWLAFVVAALGALYAWHVTAEPRFVLAAGTSYAVAVLAGWSSLPFLLVGLVTVVAVLARLRADGAEVEGTALALAAPTTYAVALWSALALVLVGDPLRWVRTNADAGAAAVPVSDLGELARATGDLVLHGAPIAVVVFPALLVVGVVRRNTFALWLGATLLVAVLAPGVAALLGLDDTPLSFDHALPVLLVAVVGALWLARTAERGAAPVAALLALGLGASVPWTFHAMATFDRQGLERAFHDAVVTGESQEGARTVGGAVVGYDREREMAHWITDHVSGRDEVLTDTASTYAVVLLTGAPGLFLDPDDRGAAEWDEVARRPAGEVRYLLMSTDVASSDRLTERYPLAARGDDPAFRVVHANPRYVLLAAPEYYTGAAADGAPAGDVGDLGGAPSPSGPELEERTS